MDAVSQKLVADILVDIIVEDKLRDKSAEVNGSKNSYKRGFFLEKPYLPSRTYLVNKKRLITEADLLDMISAGKKELKIDDDPIITPSAKLLIEEGRIKLVR